MVTRKDPFAYDDYRRLKSATLGSTPEHPGGVTTTFAYEDQPPPPPPPFFPSKDLDRLWNVTEVREAFGELQERVTRYSYDPTFPTAVATITTESVTTCSPNDPDPPAYRVETLTRSATGLVEAYRVTGQNETGPFSYITFFTYTSTGNLKSVRGPRHESPAAGGPPEPVPVVTLHYAPENAFWPWAVEFHTSFVDSFRYTDLRFDVFGNLTCMVDPNHARTSRVYDTLGRLTTLVQDETPDCNLPVTGGLVTSFAYDQNHLGHLESMTLPAHRGLPGPPQWRFFQDLAHHRNQVIDPLHNQTYSVFDRMNRLVILQRWDGQGAKRFERLYRYDVYDRLEFDGKYVVRGYPGGVPDQQLAWSRYEYDGRGGLRKFVDPKHHERNFTYDALDRLNGASGASVSAVYEPDCLDQLRRVTDGIGMASTFETSDEGVVTAHFRPDEDWVSYVHDEAGNVRNRTDAGSTRNLLYDFQDRPLVLYYTSDPADTLWFRYDETLSTKGIGRLTSTVANGIETRYHYDALGRMRSEVKFDGFQPPQVTSYDYDANGNLTQITYPRSRRTVRYTYDLADRVERVYASLGNPAVEFQLAQVTGYLPFGPVSSLVMGSNLNVTREYSQNYDILREHRRIGAASPFFGFEYTYDDDGLVIERRQVQASNPWNQRYSYTPDHQVSAWDATAGWVTAAAYAYDGNGNRRWKVEDQPPVGQVITVYSYDTMLKNRILGWSNTLGGVQGYAYDAVGNGVGSGVYEFDDLNRLAAYAPPGVSAPNGHLYEHDALGRLSLHQSVHLPTTDTWEFHYDQGGYGLLERAYWPTSGAGDPTQTDNYVWLEGRPFARIQKSAGWEIFNYIATDQVGTPVATHDASGVMTSRQMYDPFGDLIASEGPDTPLRAPGQLALNEGAGFYHNWHRVYDPRLGRYLSVDPLTPGASYEPRSWNPYGYAFGDPVSFVDPDGRFSFLAVGLVVGAYWVWNNYASPWIQENVGEQLAAPSREYGEGNAEVCDGPCNDTAGAWRKYVDAGDYAASELCFAVAARGGGKAFELAPRVAGQLADSRLGNLAGKLTGDRLQQLVNNPAAQRFLDASTGHINVIQEVDGVFLRITTASDAFRIISVGPIRPNGFANGVASGRFVPLK